MRLPVSPVIFASLALIALVLWSLTFPSDDGAAAAGTANRYLQAACAEDGDHGWDLLVGSQREAEFGDRAHYIAQAEASDCGSFTWRIRTAHCDDGACAIWFMVPDEDAIPDFLSRAGIVTYRTEKVPPNTNAGMAVVQRWIFGQGVIVPEG